MFDLIVFYVEQDLASQLCSGLKNWKKILKNLGKIVLQSGWNGLNTIHTMQYNIDAETTAITGNNGNSNNNNEDDGCECVCREVCVCVCVCVCVYVRV